MCLLLLRSCGIGFGDIENLLASVKKRRRVADFTVEPNLVVQMRAGAATAIASITNMLLKFDALAGADARARQMPIAGFEAIAIGQFQSPDRKGLYIQLALLCRPACYEPACRLSRQSRRPNETPPAF